VAGRAEKAIVAAYSGQNLATAEAVPRRLSELRVELAGADASPLERILAERVALCWLALNQYEAGYAARESEISIPRTDCQQRRITSAHRRFLSAVKALASVRKLALPVLQVNIAERQVNVAEGG
jgi:hypothetical protein